MGTPSSTRIVQDVDLELKALKIVYRKNGATIEELADRNGHRRKVVGEGKVSVGELYQPKVKVPSAKSPKICSCTVIC